jgi:hypothetical protein
MNAMQLVLLIGLGLSLFGLALGLLLRRYTPRLASISHLSGGHSCGFSEPLLQVGALRALWTTTTPCTLRALDSSPLSRSAYSYRRLY